MVDIVIDNIIIKNSDEPNKAPTIDDLDYGELAVNTYDGKLYLKQNDGVERIIALGESKDGIDGFTGSRGFVGSQGFTGSAGYTGSQGYTGSIGFTGSRGESPVVDNVLYVSMSGDDTNDGRSLAESFRTIEAALTVATAGTTIFVKSGDYTISNNPVTIPAFVSIVGDNLRSVSVRPQNTSSDIFYVNNASYISGVTFRDHVNGAAAVSFNPNGSAGNIITSPYVENSSSITSTGVGMRIDGSYVTGLRSMVADAYTQINNGGIGIHVLNRGYAQLVSIFTVSCDIGVLAENGGQCSLLNSNCSFGNFGLKSTGLSPVLYTGTTTSSSSRFDNTITLNNLTEKPKYGDAVKFSTFDTYYTVDTATDLVGGVSTITLLDTLEDNLPSGVTVQFYQRSLITASSITFEYVGTGTEIYDTPRDGGFPIQTNEIIEDDNKAGKINFTSTDQTGDFRIGNDLVIRRESGIIEGETFDRSLFAILTPYILALES